MITAWKGQSANHKPNFNLFIIKVTLLIIDFTLRPELHLAIPALSNAQHQGGDKDGTHHDVMNPRDWGPLPSAQDGPPGTLTHPPSLCLDRATRSQTLRFPCPLLAPSTAALSHQPQITATIAVPHHSWALSLSPGKGQS